MWPISTNSSAVNAAASIDSNATSTSTSETVIDVAADTFDSRGAAVVWDNGTIRSENTPHAGKLGFLYNSTLGSLVRPFLSYTSIPSIIAGAYYDSTRSTGDIPGFIETYNIDMSEYIRENIEDYESFNDFFSRKIKPEARPIASGLDEVASPADSKVLVLDGLNEKSEFMVKGKPFQIGKFLHEERNAADYEGGTIMVFRLAPQDYHRYHFPIEGTPSKAVRVDGYYESVHPAAYSAGFQPLTENERHLTFIDSEEFGEVAMVAVGAMAVGRIEETYTPDQSAPKGGEAGYFQYGGSTIALLFKKGAIAVDSQLLENSANHMETVVKMGQAVGCKPNIL